MARDDESTHYLMRILPYRAPDSTVDGTLVTFVDVSSIVQAEQHQRLLVDELNHRVKNMLTVVISMAVRRPCGRSDSLETFSKNYLARVHALSAAYALLSAQGWQAVSLKSIVEEETKPFLSIERPNIVISGPEILLEPRSALALGMAIHELTTNAVKYGALSVPEGDVEIRWKTDDGEFFLLDWIESNGPAVTPPARNGFGLSLIERGLRQDMAADVKIDFALDGVKATVRAPTRLATREGEQTTPRHGG